MNACKACNATKADLEVEISAVSMQADAHGRFPNASEEYAAEARRKAAGARSRMTGKPIADSAGEKELALPMPWTSAFMSIGPHQFSMPITKATMTATFSGPAPVDSQRVGNLAKMQMMAFFFFVTFNAEQRVGRFWRGDFGYYPEARRSDWGRKSLRGFTELVANWEPRLLKYGVDDFFNVVMRKHPDFECWSWALEWNQSFRVMGFFGDKTVWSGLDGQIPIDDFHESHLTDGSQLMSRFEEPRDSENDKLFAWHAE